MKHPYEFGGILFTIAVISGLFGGMLYNDYDGSWFVRDSMINQTEEFTKEIKSPTKSIGSWADYYNAPDKLSEQTCKKSAYDLQDFYKCMNE